MKKRQMAYPIADLDVRRRERIGQVVGFLIVIGFVVLVAFAGSADFPR